MQPLERLLAFRFLQKLEETLKTFVEAAVSLRRVCGAARSCTRLQVSSGGGAGGNAAVAMEGNGQQFVVLSWDGSWSRAASGW